MNILKKFFKSFIILSCLTLIDGHIVYAKGFWKKVAKYAINNPFDKKFLIKNPVRPLTQIVPGPNKFVPIDPVDFKEGIYQDNFCVVQEGALYRSAQLSGDALDEYIKRYGIKTIINLRGKHPELSWYVDEKATADRNNVMLCDIPTSADTLTSKKNLTAILEVFDHALRPLLVHCRAGVDRTGEVSALWVMDQQGKSNTDALNELALWHRHSELLHPAKKFLITIWRGREWFFNEYDPHNYPQFKS